MDYSKLLRELHAERDKLVKVIETLEEIQKSAHASPPEKAKRGRKTMGAEERQEVAKRMKRYWEAKRAQEQSGGSKE